MFETELKFQVPPERVAAVRTAMKAAAPRRQHLQALYFDTADGTLAQAGIALRLRREGPRWVQTLKARGAHAAERHEHNVPLRSTSRAPGPGPRPDLARHAGTPAAAAWAAALGEPMDGFDAARLQPVMATDIWRRSLRLDRGEGQVVELAFDEGEVRAAAAVATVCELEYELVEGDLAGLVRCAAEGVALHGLWLDTVSKAERGELLARGLAHPPPVHFKPAVLPRQADGAALWRAALGSAVAMLLPNASALAAGSAAAEHVHQLRIAIRRLRCAVRELGPVVGLAAEPAWLPPLVALFQALGAGRDEAALLQGLAPRLQAAGAPCTDWRAGAAVGAAAAPAGLLRAAAVQQALLQLLVDSQAWPEGLDAAAARRHIGSRLAALHEQAAQAGRHFDRLPEAQQHRARKRIKRLRYLADVVAGLYDKPRVQARFAQPLAAAQDALGGLQDVVTALPLYRAATARLPEAWFAVGWLTAEHEQAQRRSGKALRALGRAKPFW